ncbi:MAG: PsbP-related protein [Nitrososphaeraceae archaeon]
MKKFMTLLLIFIAVVDVFFYSFSYNLASASSEEFETYSNEDFGFSIDYPSNWLAKEDRLQPNQIVIFHLDPEEFEELPSPATVSVWNLLWTGGNLSITEVDDEYGTKDTVNTRLVSKNLTTLSGFPTVENIYYDYRNELNQDQNNKAMEIFAKTDNEIFFVFYIIHPGYFDEYLPEVNRMIESFKVN